MKSTALPDSPNGLIRDMRVEWRPIASLVPYARNARTHSDAQVAQIAASLREFGWTFPVLADGSSGIIAGHGRVLAAQQLGETMVPVLEAAHLTDAQRRAYVLVDNKLALNAGWNPELLGIELGELQATGFDLALTGFSESEIGKALGEPMAGLDRSLDYESQYAVTVVCRDETHQKTVYEQLTAMGLECKVVCV